MSWRKSRNRMGNAWRPRVEAALHSGAGVERLEARVVLATIGVQMPDFQLVDQNLNSDQFGDTISPREYLQQVSGWYFIHTT
ncbi:MAG: hypothetical protein SGJ19_15890 [Planctomycetia bacterium]|nr:hypothetical protein [Planctomycetia bacterium]